MADSFGPRIGPAAHGEVRFVIGKPSRSGRKLTRVVDTIHFAPSAASRLVQAADLIAFLHRRRSSGPERDERAQEANDRLWAVISPKIHHQHCWVP